LVRSRNTFSMHPYRFSHSRSSFGLILFPGAPAGLTIVGEKARLEQKAGRLILSADIDIVLPYDKAPRRVHEENSLSLVPGQKVDIPKWPGTWELDGQGIVPHGPPEAET
jgi:hypothetical protein